MKIRNVESFYNYRTVLNDNEIKIVSSGLSSESQFIELNHFTTGVAKNEEYRIEMENIIPEQDVKLQHLHLKKCRMQGLLAKILDKPLNDNRTSQISTCSQACILITGTSNTANRTIPSQISVSPAFTTSIATAFNSRSSTSTPSTTCKLTERFLFDIKNSDNLVGNEGYTAPRPKLCREKDSNTKQACIKCSQICSFPIEMILDPLNHMSQDDIRDELQLHGHPKSRVIDRTTINGKSKAIGAKSHEQARELADHYIFAHNKKEPLFH